MKIYSAKEQKIKQTAINQMNAALENLKKLSSPCKMTIADKTFRMLENTLDQAKYI